MIKNTAIKGFVLFNSEKGMNNFLNNSQNCDIKKISKQAKRKTIIVIKND